MALYEYEGLDGQGKKHTGVVEADSPRSARNQLKKEGIFVTGTVEASAGEVHEETLRRSVYFGREINATELAMITRQLATLIGAGLPLVDALGSLIEQIESARTRRVLSGVRQKVNEGGSFYEALTAYPKVFDEFYRNMVRAGEVGGTLELVLTRLADFLEKQVAFRRKVQASMAYPVLMAVVAVAVLIVLMAKVVPQITSVFANLGKELPPTTKLLLFVSGLVKSYWVAGVILFALGLFFLDRYSRTPHGRLRMHQFALALPRAGAFYRTAALSRLSRTLGTLVGAGVPLLDALAVARPVVGNAVIEDALERSAVLVREGWSLSAAMKESGEFPSEIRRMVAVGEESGALETMLLKVSESYETRLEAVVVSLTSLLEPLMILGMGLIVGFVVYSILLPIFNLTEAIR